MHVVTMIRFMKGTYRYASGPTTLRRPAIKGLVAERGNGLHQLRRIPAQCTAQCTAQIFVHGCNIGDS